jgi:hypothetical protein
MKLDAIQLGANHGDCLSPNDELGFFNPAVLGHIMGCVGCVGYPGYITRKNVSVCQKMER